MNAKSLFANILRAGTCVQVCLLLATNAARGACPSDAGVTTPITSTNETSVLATSRQLVDSNDTEVDLGTPGKVSIKLKTGSAPVPITINTYSGGNVFQPTPNTFTSVTNATQINLPNTGAVPVGSVYGITIGGAQGSTAIVTNNGAADENITFNGTTTNPSISIENGDVVQLVNQGSGQWLVVSYVNHNGNGITTFSATDLTPLFTSSVANPGTAPALSFTLSNAAPYTVLGNGTGTAAPPSYQSLVTQQLPQRAVVMGGNGGSSGLRPLPPSGTNITLTGEYWHVGDYNTNTLTGGITCNRCRIHIVGNFTIANAITVSSELKGGLGFPIAAGLAGSAPGQRGQGLGAGDGGYQFTGGTSAVGMAGGGGANGGNGGRGGAFNATTTSSLGGAGGLSYAYEHQLVGSGGGGGGSAGVAVAGGNGGNGGGALYIEASGDVTIDANITAAGGAGGDTSTTTAAAGGGGSGGTAVILAGGNIGINSGRTVDLSGGRGGNASVGANTPGGGGGGGGRFFARAGGTYSNAGTINVNGGIAGTGGASTQAAVAGSTGVTDATGSTGYSIRTAP